MFNGMPEKRLKIVIPDLAGSLLWSCLELLASEMALGKQEASELAVCWNTIRRRQ